MSTTESKVQKIPENFMTERFPLKKRKYGEEQPGIKLGPFTLRLPLIHHEWQWTEFAAAMFLGVACLGAGVTTTMTTFGLDVPENITALGLNENSVFLMALTFGVLNAICYYLPSLLGDPVVPGWITPALPLTIAYLSQWQVPNYATGDVDRIKAMIALQMMVALSFLLMGATGIGRKLVESIPMSIKAGIVLGAGVTAGINVINARIPKAPWTVIIACLLAYLFLFNPSFARMAKKSDFWRVVRNQGVVPAQLFAIILAPILLKEIPMPQIQWGFTPLNFGFVLEHFTIFGLGLPEASFFISAIPMALTVYIIAFSDFVLAKEIVTEATSFRSDETVIFDAGRSNLVSFLRNGIMALFAPWVPMCGPLWASGLLTITERYKRGYKTMRTYWGGVCTFRAATVIAVLILPLVTLIRPAFAIFFGITMAVQCFACGNIGMRMATTTNERGIACVMAAVLACKTPGWALLTGVILWLLIEASEVYYLKNHPSEANS
ncbi:hypothetical protein ACS3UN_01860 [Oscillospiraceae bacterium LTW-04]|nr:hypothetical protein RBH76_08600 [Oscillospiraceae bacterium MB24-C1]